MAEGKLTKVKDWSEDDRPREKLMLRGINSLTNAELLAILIGSGTRGESVVDLSKRILNDYKNNLHELGKVGVHELTKKYKGVGPAKAISIVAALELGKRRQSHEVIEKPKISSSNDSYKILAPLVSDLRHEEFWILLLNRANMVIHKMRISSGGQVGTVVDVSTIIKAALDYFALGIILCHNHPSGNLRPSREDMNITEKLKNAASLFDIRVLDHLIITNSGYYSFADEGVM